MKLSRRHFIGLAAGLGLSSCQKMGLDNVSFDKLTPDMSAMPVIGKDGKFTFATINDLHVLDAKSAAIVNRAVIQINANESIQFTVILGDVATDGAVQEMRLAKQALDKLNRPYFVIPGNHDVAPARENEYANFEEAFGDRQWDKRDLTQWAFIGLDTCNGTASDVTVPADRMEWLARRLKGINKGRPIALFAHHPFNPNTQAYRVQNADEVLGLFSGHNLKLVASGHFHGNQIEERDGILFTTTACCSTTRDNHDGTPAKGFRVYQVDKDTFTHEFIEVPA